MRSGKLLWVRWLELRKRLGNPNLETLNWGFKRWELNEMPSKLMNKAEARKRWEKYLSKEQQAIVALPRPPFKTVSPANVIGKRG